MATSIHASSIVDKEAKLGENVQIGPFCIVGPNAEIGDNCVLKSHVVIEGFTKIGKDNIFHQFCSIGNTPQDTTYKGEPTKVQIGDGNIFREFISIHRGTLKQDGITILGNNGFYLSYAHIAHDCVIGNNVTIGHAAAIAGHVTVGDRCILSGSVGITQFVTIGRGAFIGGGSAIDRDIPSYCTAYGNRIKLKGINIIGLKRRGYNKQFISEVVDFYRTMESSALSPRAFVDHPELISEYDGNEVIEEIAAFIAKSEIGVAPFTS